MGCVSASDFVQEFSVVYTSRVQRSEREHLLRIVNGPRSLAIPGMLSYTYTYAPRAVGPEPHVDQVSEGRTLGDCWAAFVHTYTALTLPKQVMRDVSTTLKTVYNAHSAVLLPGSGTFAMEARCPKFQHKCAELCTTCASVWESPCGLILNIA